MDLYEPVHVRFEKFCKARAYGNFNFKDLMHDALVVAYERFESLKKDEAFLHFLFGIAIRLLANENRKRSTERLSDHLQAYNYSLESDRTDKLLEINLLYEAISRLPDLQKESIILFEISGFSIKEIAELQQSSEDAVKQRLVRSRKKLLELMTEEMDVEQKNMSYDRR
ncbi:RNA polymerase, sigma-24 subunit, ECF subfamily [Fluviicola taffensis DSM 16823]|uniref:RNA polymerase, sigma-24 subunit, ECF subfamily n=2 Tax=Fluviicola TaxID=332102 RepID=F2ICF3_FLUTR|nr:RNA polymerase, sigma-24 subunit, ECF subfamily [Fluviicola taffensis DSM 16823]